MHLPSQEASTGILVDAGCIQKMLGGDFFFTSWGGYLYFLFFVYCVYCNLLYARASSTCFFNFLVALQCAARPMRPNYPMTVNVMLLYWQKNWKCNVRYIYIDKSAISGIMQGLKYVCFYHNVCSCKWRVCSGKSATVIVLHISCTIYWYKKLG